MALRKTLDQAKHSICPTCNGTGLRPESTEPFDVYLDDIRTPPDEWKCVRSLDELKALLTDGLVDHLSLDHDLGACQKCMGGATVEEWLANSEGRSMPHCSHVGTGYDLVCWMEETGCWPLKKPVVHSANPVGRARMNIAIDASWPRRRLTTP